MGLYNTINLYIVLHMDHQTIAAVIRDPALLNHQYASYAPYFAPFVVIQSAIPSVAHLLRLCTQYALFVIINRTAIPSALALPANVAVTICKYISHIFRELAAIITTLLSNRSTNNIDDYLRRYVYTDTDFDDLIMAVGDFTNDVIRIATNASNTSDVERDKQIDITMYAFVSQLEDTEHYKHLTL